MTITRRLCFFPTDDDDDDDADEFGVGVSFKTYLAVCVILAILFL